MIVAKRWIQVCKYSCDYFFTANYENLPYYLYIVFEYFGGVGESTHLKTRERERETTKS